MKASNLYNTIQYILYSFAMACYITAVVTILFGEDNFFQSSPYPFFTVIFLSLFALVRLEK